MGSQSLLFNYKNEILVNIKDIIVMMTIYVSLLMALQIIGCTYLQ